MMNIKKNIGGKLFKVTSEEYLSKQADAIIEVIGNIELNKLKDNFKVQVGWSIFKVVEDSEGFNIIAPDYNRNPFTESTDDLTISLWVQLEQSILLNKLNLDGEMISFQDKVVCSKGVLKLDKIYLERSKEHEKYDSGWYIGPVDETIATDELEAYYAYQLLKIRPSIIKTLALPSGYMAILEKDELK
ncbi:immunity protein Imm33 domain-containing protein, partial [Clostridium sp. CTA-19]